IDAVGRAEAMLAAQDRVAKRLLDQSLTIVEGAIDPKRQHIVAPAGQLPFLAGAHKSFRIKDDPPGPGAPMKRGSHSAAGVARRGDQYGQRVLGGLMLDALLAFGQKSGAEVLERRGGAMIKLQNVQGIAA